MNYMRKYFSVAVLLIIIGVFLFFYFYEEKAATNIKNCEKITIGNSKDVVIQTMGNPSSMSAYSTRINGKMDTVINYEYDAPSLASTGVNMFFDADTSKVIKVECYEEVISSNGSTILE